MSGATVRTRRADRITGLRRRGEFERDVLAREVAGLRAEMERTGSRWKTAGWIAGGLAAAWTVGHRLFGKNSLSARLGRLTSVASVLFGLGKAVGKARKLW
jgi:hypothetical protein